MSRDLTRAVRSARLPRPKGSPLPLGALIPSFSRREKGDARLSLRPPALRRFRHRGQRRGSRASRACPASTPIHNNGSRIPPAC